MVVFYLGFGIVRSMLSITHTMTRMASMSSRKQTDFMEIVNQYNVGFSVCGYWFRNGRNPYTRKENVFS